MRRALFAMAPCSLVIFACSVWGQGPPAGAFRPPAAGRGNAPFDLTGYWIGQITEDWRYRMTAAPKGDVGGIPVNAEGRRIAAAWDPEKDAPSEDSCKAYGVGGVMHMPGRLHITWDADDTVKIEAEAGAQTPTLFCCAAQSGWRLAGRFRRVVGSACSGIERVLHRKRWFTRNLTQSRDNQSEPGIPHAQWRSLRCECHIYRVL